VYVDLPAEDAALIARAKASGAPVVTTVFSGRPLKLGAAMAENSPDWGAGVHPVG
jgi:hypothetical protein